MLGGVASCVNERSRSIWEILRWYLVILRGRCILEVERKWLSGGEPPCQGGGREFESRLPLQLSNQAHGSYLDLAVIRPVKEVGRAS